MAENEEFSRFMAGRYAALVRTAFLLTADRGRAEDLVHASLIRTYLAWDRLHDVGSAEAYTRTARSEAEIATALRCSPGTVKSRAARGLAALRAAGVLADERPEPSTIRGVAP